MERASAKDTFRCPAGRGEREDSREVPQVQGEESSGVRPERVYGLPLQRFTADLSSDGGQRKAKAFQNEFQMIDPTGLNYKFLLKSDDDLAGYL